MPLRKMLTKYSSTMGKATMHWDTMSGGVTTAAMKKMTLAAALEYMHAKPRAASARDSDDEQDDDTDGEERERDDEYEDEDQRARDEAGADWMSDQGFDRKDLHTIRDTSALR